MAESSRGENAESQDLKIITEVEPIEQSREKMIETKEQIKELVEAPLLAACEELYDKNIQTLSTSANKNDVLYGGYINIDFDSLSEKNKEIAKTLGELSGGGNSRHVKIKIPLNENTTVEEIKSFAESVVGKFEKQPMKWAPRYTLKDLREIYCDGEAQVEDFSGRYYYDSEEKLFYLSEEHFKKVKEK